MYSPALHSDSLTPDAARFALASALRSASQVLARVASAMAPASPAATRLDEARLEFHAEAGAPEGALYVDGQLVGLLEGVNRL